MSLLWFFLIIIRTSLEKPVGKIEKTSIYRYVHYKITYFLEFNNKIFLKFLSLTFFLVEKEKTNLKI